MRRVGGLEQGSPAWHDWRAKGIGASDVANLVGTAKWNSPAKLRASKDGTDTFKGNALTRRGSRLEPQARRLVEGVTGYRFTPCCVVHDDYEFIKASLDGLTEDGLVILEVKCPKTSKYHREALDGHVPDHYRPQVQHQLMICNQARLLIFASYFPDGVYSRRLALVPVKHDKRYQKILLRREVEWWRTEMLGKVAEDVGKLFEEYEKGKPLDQGDRVKGFLCLQTCLPCQPRLTTAEVVALPVALD